MDMKTRKEKAVELFKGGYGCAQAVLGAYCEEFGLDMETALKIACSFGAGMGRMREVCGAVTGMFMVAGLYNGMSDGSMEGKKENYELVVKLADEFKKRNNGTIICRELMGLEPSKDVDTTPEKRTDEYYKKRPCVANVEDCVDIIEEVIMSKIGGTDKQVEFVRVSTQEQIATIADLAEYIIIHDLGSEYSDEEIRAIIDKYQSGDVIASRIINNGCSYYMVKEGNDIIGYVGSTKYGNVLKFGMCVLDKYLNYGYIKAILDKMHSVSRVEGLDEMVMTCSVTMENTIKALNEWGFKGERIIDTEIDYGCIIKQQVFKYTL